MAGEMRLEVAFSLKADQNLEWGDLLIQAQGMTTAGFNLLGDDLERFTTIRTIRYDLNLHFIV